MKNEKEQNINETPDEQVTQADKPKSKRSKREKKEKPKRNWKYRLSVWGIIVALLVGTVLVLLFGKLLGNRQSDEILTTPDHLIGKTMNILVCGVDNDESRNEADEAWLTDVIMVVSIDRATHAASILQIPRDLYIGSDIVETGKINALYYYGIKGTEDDEGDRIDGITALKMIINDQFQLPIDHHILITMESFRTAINMLGGIEVTIDQRVDFGENMILDPGTHLLTGEQADLFVRNRNYATADIGRQEMQRYFMAALMSRLRNTSKMEMASLGLALHKYLNTDMSINQLLQLADEMQQLATETIQVVRVPGEPVAAYGYYGLDVFTAHRAELAEMLNTYMRPYVDPVPESDLKVIELQKTIDWYDSTEGSLGEYTKTEEDGA